MFDNPLWTEYTACVSLYVVALKNANRFRKERPLHEGNSEYYAPALAFAQRRMEEAFNRFLKENANEAE